MKGQRNRVYRFTCGGYVGHPCHQRMTVSRLTWDVEIHAADREAREAGWIETEQRGWVCPDCQKPPERSRLARIVAGHRRRQPHENSK